MHPEILNALSLLENNSWSADDLYTYWWSGKSNIKKRRPIPQTLHQSVFSKKLFWEDKKRIDSIVTRAVIVKPGEFIDLDEQTSIILRRKTWSSDWWNWLQTSDIETYPSDRILRLYIPSVKLDVEVISEQLFLQFEDSRVPATLKFRRHFGVFADETVIWVEENSLPDALLAIFKVVNSSDFVCSPPPLTQFYRGIGIADDPIDGDSLGWKICQLLWAYSSSNRNFDIKQKFESNDLNMLRPWLINRDPSEKTWEEVLC
jgi:hypothetical protein